MNYIYIIGVFVVAFAIAFLLTPIVKKLAVKLKAIDVPNEKRRVHDHPIPRLGGLAIVIGFSVATLIYAVLSYGTVNTILDNRLIGLFLGIIVIEIAGILDDIYQLKAWNKLIFQIIAATIVVAFGVRIEGFSNPFIDDGYIGLGVFSIPITMVWIVGITNAINFIDGLDGLAAGTASISSLALLFISVFSGDIETVILTSALAGATLGFLPFNFNPAKIFMGEAGSAFLGFTLGTIAIMGMLKSTVIAVIAPLVVLGLPIFDTAFAIIRRIAKGKSPMCADRGHLHHRLVDAGLTQKQTVLILYAISASLGIIGFMLVQSGILKIVLLLVAIALFAFAGQRVLTDINHTKED